MTRQCDEVGDAEEVEEDGDPDENQTLRPLHVDACDPERAGDEDVDCCCQHGAADHGDQEGECKVPEIVEESLGEVEGDEGCVCLIEAVDDVCRVSQQADEGEEDGDAAGEIIAVEPVGEDGHVVPDAPAEDEGDCETQQAFAVGLLCRRVAGHGDDADVQQIDE